MSGTSASVSRSKGGLILPAPVVRLSMDTSGDFRQVSQGDPQNNTTVKVQCLNIASASVHGIPAEILKNLDKYKPKLELIRHVRRRTKAPQFSRNFKSSGYVHPAHMDAPSGQGHHTHGGGTSLFPNINAIRPTEWDVTNWGQVIDVTQGLHGFMQIGRFNYRDNSGNIVGVEAVHPSGSKINSNMGKRMPYSGIFRPGYYQLRWSIIDPTDLRGQRISGPRSDVIALTNEVFPFIPSIAFNGLATADVDPRFRKETTMMWIGSVSRLPR
jgi:hypothetical protein